SRRHLCRPPRRSACRPTAGLSRPRGRCRPAVTVAAPGGRAPGRRSGQGVGASFFGFLAGFSGGVVLVAPFRAASGPSASSTAKPAGARPGTPTCSALSYLEPGLSPATTNEVFFDTEPVTLPPRV